MNFNEKFNKDNTSHPVSEDFFDVEKYSQVLRPISDKEREVFARIDKADAPIRNILKRINRLSLNKFPEDNFITSDSCSGHVTSENTIKEEPHIFFNIKPNYRTVEQEGEEFDEIDDFNEMNTEKYIEFFRKVFIDSINKVNIKYNQEVMSFGYFDYKNNEEGQFINKEYINKEPVLSYDPRTKDSFYVYSVGYFFSLKDVKEGKILQDFWGAVEDSLSENDGIKYKTNFKAEEFLKKDTDVSD
jgi:hypothetical protein